MGFCPQCGSVDPLVEVGAASRAASPASAVTLAEAKEGSHDRVPTGWGEVDRVLGGGLVPGSVVLLGGEPGVGKSTLLLQLAGGLAGQGRTALVASAEESVQQVAMRASRLGISSDRVTLVADDDVDAVVSLAAPDRPPSRGPGDGRGSGSSRCACSLRMRRC